MNNNRMVLLHFFSVLLLFGSENQKGHCHRTHFYVTEYLMSQMTTDMFRLAYSQSGPFPVHDLSPGL